MKYTTLPDNVPNLIRVAIHDLKLCMNDDRYEINMDVWHSMKTNNKCHVCFAGSVLAKSCEFDINSNIFILDKYTREEEELKKKMYALNSLREGSIDYAYFQLRRTAPKLIVEFPIIDICPYNVNKDKFIEDMTALADYIELCELIDYLEAQEEIQFIYDQLTKSV